MIKDRAFDASEASGRGMVQGVKNQLGTEVKNLTGFDTGKSLSDNFDSMRNQFINFAGSKPEDGWMGAGMKVMKDNPWGTALGVGGLALGGYGAGKMFGLWGNDSDNSGGNRTVINNNNNTSGGGTGGGGGGGNKGFANPYTNTPQALTKMSNNIQLAENTTLKIPDLPLPRIFSTPASLGLSLYDALEEPADNPAKNSVEITPENSRTNNKMHDPKVRAYLNSLIARTYR
jgi:hypothetical protein